MDIQVDIKTLGIFADTLDAATGMAVVNYNLAYHLSRVFDDEVRTIYFGRFGQKEKGIAPNSTVYDAIEVVPCEGGVWKEETVEKAIKTYGVDIVYSEDDWWSTQGLIKATKRTKKPFYFMTPIDSLPIRKEGKYLLERYCNLVFVPNKSYRYLKNGVYLPHSINYNIFKPSAPKAFDKFTFLWVGRDERRKALGRTISAFEKIYKKYDCNLLVRSNWGDAQQSINTLKYIERKRLPIIRDKMTDCPHDFLAQVYSSCNALLCTSKAGGFEMQILEANGCGLPVIATDWTFMNENVRDGETGFLVPVESYDFWAMKNRNNGIWGNISIDKLSQRMAYMVENQEEMEIMGMEGIRYVRSLPTWKDIAIKLYEIIEDDMNKKTFIKKEKK